MHIFKKKHFRYIDLMLSINLWKSVDCNCRRSGPRHYSRQIVMKGYRPSRVNVARTTVVFIAAIGTVSHPITLFVVVDALGILAQVFRTLTG